ncbi:MAG: serine O-acetyltransferase EpsC [Candidatus Hermodarchaeota archaeon]
MTQYKEEIFLDAAEEAIEKIAGKLCENDIYRSLNYAVHHTIPKPSLFRIGKIISLLRELIFPGYFSEWKNKNILEEEIKKKLQQCFHRLKREVFLSYCFECRHCIDKNCILCLEKANLATKYLFLNLPRIREVLLMDVQAAFEGDPAAKSVDEVILSYPAIRAITNYRIAHELYIQGVPLIPRIITELAHSETGIDIHPGAQIGERFFIDHGTGVVIGETTEIGKNVRLYQGVTLGAKSFPLDKDGRPVKDVLRHPIIEDDVIIYAGATILGRIRIGKGSVIGSNVTVLHDVSPRTKIVQRKPIAATFADGAGI